MPFGLAPKYLFPQKPELENPTWFEADFSWSGVAQGTETEPENLLIWLDADHTWG